MRIAVLYLSSGGVSSGAVRYFEEVLPRLVKYPGVSRIKVFLPEGIELRGNIDRSGVEWFGGHGNRSLRRLKTLISETSDVVFIPTARWMDCGSLPIVVMVRNMEPLVAPFGGNPLMECGRNLARALLARRACQKSQRVIAVSGFVRDFLTRRWRIDERRVALIYHGIEKPSSTDLMRQPGNIDSGFIFTAGTIRPYRGLEDLIYALGILKNAGRPYHLVVAGRPDPRTGAYQKNLQSIANRIGVSHLITWTGQLNYEEMRWCLTNSSVFVMTTRVEACPNTALEAMSYGKLCVVADNPPMAEFFGTAAEYYPVGNAMFLASSIQGLLEESAEAKDRRRKALLDRASKFNWDNTVAATVVELEKAMSGRR